LFQHDQARSRVAAKRDDIVTLLESVNQPLVALPGRPGEAAKASIVGHRVEGGFIVVIALAFPDTGTNVIFVDDRGPVDPEALRPMFDEAVQFAESMGFILDDTKWREQTDAGKDDLLVRLQVFQEPPKGARLPPQDEKLLRLARLLTSF
jgi:hypothetical protein